MSDSDIQGNAWTVPPSSYFSARTRPYSVPATPRSFYVPMRDGCRIAMDLYLPQAVANTPAAGPFPTVVIFTPYNRRFKLMRDGIEPTPNAARYRDAFVPAGYAVLVVDVRGTGASFGVRDALRSPNETADFAEIADWISRQPWSNGAVGSTGISYLGAAACFLAGSGHPAVKAIAPLFAVSDIYSEQLYIGGLLSTVWVSDYDDMMVALDQDDRELIQKFGYFNNPGYAGPQPVDEDPDGTLLAQAIAEHRNNFKMAELAPQFLFRDESTLHDPNLNTSACSPFHYYAGIRPEVAVYSISGWYDGGGYANGAIARFLTLQNKHNRLLLGPWDHGARTNVSPWRDKPASDFPLMAEVLRFFDQHLMGIDADLQAEAPVHYYSVHANTWHAAGQWPVAQASHLHLTAEGELDRQAPTRPATLQARTRFDWSSGASTRYERLGGYNIENYYHDWQQRESELLSFDTPVLTEPLSICGSVLATLNLSASEGDAAVFLFLSEVQSDGQVRYMTEGMLRLSHRQTSQPPANYKIDQPFRTFSRADARPLTVDKPETVEVSLFPVGWTLPEGSRLRLSISGADQGHFPQVPPGRPPVLALHLGQSTSALTLPVVN
ncbi:CocE/NonD family hydrolase [Bordetella petrii]|uniref:Xaa-Pro dipeptidyl-peptidase C-terminal domain-containing protein n=1 Tax=Bordetella petrii (strain ATCC BAA-461 / DSM 12804 / CCUG 43448 / CIP 107267 / Se-1111R) TaxID=340100 RepID=A9IDQ1_BORPD|nr:CocE/NonD family hydrolase [Bordetella petrii]CAP41588.1 conserved hypothetical protein [Bordetella petrii]